MSLLLCAQLYRRRIDLFVRQYFQIFRVPYEFIMFVCHIFGNSCIYFNINVPFCRSSPFYIEHGKQTEFHKHIILLRSKFPNETIRSIML